MPLGATLTFGPPQPKPKHQQAPKLQIPFSASYLNFQSWAFQTNAQGGHNFRQFDVLCGDNPPTIVDGYGQWTVINRPLRQGLTIPQGFNPAKLQIEVRFGVWDGRFNFAGWDTSTDAAQYVEHSIDDLHWMAGGNSLGGPSPMIYINSYRLDQSTLVRTNLVPPQYKGVPWVIDAGITWGSSLRDRFGSRIYQEASFTVQGYTPPAGSQNPIPQQTRLAGGFFKTNAQVNTARAIAAANTSRTPVASLESLAKLICTNKRNNPCAGTRLHLDRRSLDWKIPPGIAVWVPAHQI